VWAYPRAVKYGASYAKEHTQNWTMAGPMNGESAERHGLFTSDVLKAEQNVFVWLTLRRSMTATGVVG
jgi:hypothetical protein